MKALKYVIPAALIVVVALIFACGDSPDPVSTLDEAPRLAKGKPQGAGKSFLSTFGPLSQGGLASLVASDVFTKLEDGKLKRLLVGFHPTTWEPLDPVEIDFNFDPKELQSLLKAPAFWSNQDPDPKKCGYVKPAINPEHINSGINAVRLYWYPPRNMGRHIAIYFPNGRLRSQFQADAVEIRKGKDRYYEFIWDNATFYWTPDCENDNWWWHPDLFDAYGPPELHLSFKITVRSQ